MKVFVLGLYIIDKGNTEGVYPYLYYSILCKKRNEYTTFTLYNPIYLDYIEREKKDEHFVKTYIREIGGVRYHFKFEFCYKTFNNVRKLRMTYFVYKEVSGGMICIGYIDDIFDVDVTYGGFYGNVKTVYDCDDDCNLGYVEEELNCSGKGKCDDCYSNTKEQALKEYAKYQGCFLMDKIVEQHLVSLAKITNQFPEQKP